MTTANHRRHYRVRRSKLRATVDAGDSAYTGRVRDTSAGGAQVSFPGDDAPLLALGDEVSLTFVGGGISGEVSVQARVQSRQDQHAHRVYGFSFSQGAPTDPLDEDGPFNRRQFRRVRPAVSVAVSVRPLDGPQPGAVQQASLLDLSGGGCALMLAVDAGEPLDHATRVACTLRLPGQPDDETRTALIRNRSQLPEGIRYGLEWVGEDTGLPGPIYEPAWDCASCGEVNLLATSHLHCPRCGGAQSAETPTYFPAWDALRPRHAHRYYGDQVACDVCGTSHGATARHCGGCGTSLPR